MDLGAPTLGRYRPKGLSAECRIVDASSTVVHTTLDVIRVGEVEVSTAELEFYGPVSMTLVYKANGTQRGHAARCGAGRVILVPLDLAMQGPGFERSGQSDSKDSYEITAVRLGDYYAMAFTWDSTVRWNAAKFDNRLLNQAIKVTGRAKQPLLTYQRFRSRRFEMLFGSTDGKRANRLLPE